MTTIIDIVSKIAALLEPLSEEERRKVVRMIAAYNGEATPAAESLMPEADAQEDDLPVSSQARVWMKRHGISTEELEQVYHLGSEGIEIIASDIPGRSGQQVRHVYLLSGIQQLLSDGRPVFADGAARAVCGSFGCYDPGNHSKYVASFKNEVSGNKERGWTLTTPGLKRAAELIKKIAEAAK